MKPTAIQKPERRFGQLTGVTVRAAGEGAAPLISGHAAVFNQMSEDLGGFREQVAPGAFKRTIRNADVRALFNHDSNFVLGRTKAGTLTLAEDLEGLAIQIQPPETMWAGDLMTSMERGDLDQMSFGFRVIKDKWESGEGGQQLRTLLEVELYDVSVVTWPAYPQTDAAVRSYLSAAGLEIDELPDSFAAARLLVESRQVPTSDPPEPGHSLELLSRSWELEALAL